MLRDIWQIVREHGWKRLAFRIFQKTLPFRVAVSWMFLSVMKNYKGVTEEKRKRKIVVSLTSFPARIDTVYKTVQSLLRQSIKPDELILWLAPEQFPEGEDNLPKKLLKLKEAGLKVGWHTNLRSYTKLIPTLKTNPEDIIVTADDDIYYETTWLERLWRAYGKNPSQIHCHRITQFYIKAGTYRIRAGGHSGYGNPNFLHKITGVGGALYPPHIFYPDVLKEDLFSKLAPTNDDIWFWLMAVLNGVKINVIQDAIPDLEYVGCTQEGVCLNQVNDRGEKLFWKDFYRMLEYYPEIDGILRKEYSNIEKREL